MTVEQELAQFQETEGGGAFSLQGDVKFEHAGSGGVSRMLKKAVTNGH